MWCHGHYESPINPKHRGQHLRRSVSARGPFPLSRFLILPPYWIVSSLALCHVRQDFFIVSIKPRKINAIASETLCTTGCHQIKGARRERSVACLASEGRPE